MSLYGLMAQFDSPAKVLEAAQHAFSGGYREFDAFSPYPVDGLAEATGFRRTRVPLIVLLGAIFGAAGGYFMQYYANVYSFPLNSGGRPYHSWPAFVPVTFELTILCAAISAVLGMIFLNGLPRPYHPVFNCEAFVRASRDRFFLCITSADPLFDVSATRDFLETLDHEGVFEVLP